MVNGMPYRIDPETLSRVKAAVASAADHDLGDIGDDHPILESGIITSLDIVMIAASLEEEFQIEIPDSAITMENFHSLRALGAMVSSMTQTLGEVGFSEKRPNVILLSLGGALRRPALFAVFVAVSFLALDTFAGFAVMGPLAPYLEDFNEKGMRLYPAVGGNNAIDDLKAAVDMHEISGPPAAGGLRVAFFGDSGTMGSFVRAEDAIPAQAELALKERYKDAKCYNLAYYQTSYVKDAMILEAVLQASGGKPPFDIAVFTMSEFYFHPLHGKRIVQVMPSFGFNDHLFRSFVKRAGKQESQAYKQIMADLALARKNGYWPLEPQMARHLNLYKLGPRMRFLFQRHAPFQELKTSYKFEYHLAVTGKKQWVDDSAIDPPDGFILHDYYLTKESVRQNISMTVFEDIVSFLELRGVKILVYLKPVAPAAWEGKYKQGPYTSPKLAADIAQMHPMGIVDARFALKGSQFTDSLTHYSAEGNRIIGRMIAGKLADMAQEAK